MMRKPDKWALFEHPAASTYDGFGGKVVLLADWAHASTRNRNMDMQDDGIQGNYEGR